MEEKSVFDGLKDMSVLSLKKNDVIVLRAKGFLTAQMVDNINTHIREMLNQNDIENDIIVLDEGLDIAVLRKDE